MDSLLSKTAERCAVAFLRRATQSSAFAVICLSVPLHVIAPHLRALPLLRLALPCLRAAFLRKAMPLPCRRCATIQCHCRALHFSPCSAFAVPSAANTSMLAPALPLLCFAVIAVAPLISALPSHCRAMPPHSLSLRCRCRAFLRSALPLLFSAAPPKHFKALPLRLTPALPACPPPPASPSLPSSPHCSRR